MARTVLHAMAREVVMSERFLTTVTGRAPRDHVCWSSYGVDEARA